MIADVVEYTAKEGGEWRKWPWPARHKPTNPQLLTHKPASTAVLTIPDFKGNPIHIRVHSLRLSNGREWDSINGFRDGGGPA